MRGSRRRWGIWRKHFAIAIYNSAVKPEVGYYNGWAWLNFYHLYIRIG